MKKTIFLSFRPEFYKPILYGMKKYEYRKRFCQEATTAYLYLSSPVKEVVGIMELGIPLNIEHLKEQYQENKIIYKRLEEYYQNREVNAIPIESLQLFKEPIPFYKLNEVDKNFKAPRCYLLLEHFPKVYEYLKKQPMYEKEFYHEHNKIYENNIAVSCKEMEKTEEYKRRQKL